MDEVPGIFQVCVWSNLLRSYQLNWMPNTWWRICGTCSSKQHREICSFNKGMVWVTTVILKKSIIQVYISFWFLLCLNRQFHLWYFHKCWPLHSSIMCLKWSKNISNGEMMLYPISSTWILFWTHYYISDVFANISYR